MEIQHRHAPRKLDVLSLGRERGSWGMKASILQDHAPCGEAAASERSEALLLVPVSAGELIDKMTILAIKTDRVRHVQKRLMAAQELALLKGVAAPLLADPAIAPLMAELTQVNLALWRIEDSLRAHEQRQVFDKEFVELARKVYFTNDERARLKNEVNAAAGCALIEVKEHPEY